MKNYLPRGAHAPIYPLIFSALVSTQGTLLSLTAVNSPILAALRRSYQITPAPIMLGNQREQARQRTQGVLFWRESITYDRYLPALAQRLSNGGKSR